MKRLSKTEENLLDALCLDMWCSRKQDEHYNAKLFNHVYQLQSGEENACKLLLKRGFLFEDEHLEECYGVAKKGWSYWKRRLMVENDEK